MTEKELNTRLDNADTKVVGASLVVLLGAPFMAIQAYGSIYYAAELHEVKPSNIGAAVVSGLVAAIAAKKMPSYRNEAQVLKRELCALRLPATYQVAPLEFDVNEVQTTTESVLDLRRLDTARADAADLAITAGLEPEYAMTPTPHRLMRIGSDRP